MRKSIGFGTLGSRIYITFTVMIFATIFIMQLIAFRFTLNTVRNSTLETNQAMLGQLTRQIDSYIQGMERIASAVLDDPGLQRLLTEEGIGGDRLAVQTMLTHYIQARDDISEILIFPPDGSVIASDPEMEINPWTDFTERPWYIEAVAAGGRIVVSGSYVQNLVKGQYSWVVSLSRQIIDADSGKELGVLLVDLKFNRIQELCQSMVIGKKGYNFVIDEQGNYVFHPTQQLVYSDLKREPIDRILDLTGYGERITYSDGERYFMVDTSPLTGWHMVSVLRSDEIITEWSNVQIGYAIIGLVLFLIVGIATNSVTLGITKPIRQLQNTMKSVDTGDFQLVGRIRATEEIRELAREYDIMVSRIRELMQENIREQELKRKSDLKALQAQINPHFLYNTLDSIIWMGEMKQHSEVVLMTSALSKLFRISISKGRELISIKDEIDHVQSYLTIEDMRYRNKFDYIIDVEPALYEFEILKITLQPLVENAIYHGIKEIDGRGRISIKGEKRDDTIVFTVQDNGRGMEAEKLRLLNSALKDPFQEQGRHARGGMGVGIRNVHARLMLYFGEDYGLSCESRRREGTTITILFPARKGDYPA
jgi:two-component system, sensor histidine kinase YesM